MNFSKKAAAHMQEKHGGLFSIKDVQKGMVDFSSNILPGGPPPKVAKAMRSALAEAAKYPDPDSSKMKECQHRTGHTYGYTMFFLHVCCRFFGEIHVISVIFADLVCCVFSYF